MTTDLPDFDQWEARIDAELAQARGPADRVFARETLAKARGLAGLNKRDVAVLLGVSDPRLLEELFAAARHVKREVYGSRLVFFAPLYVSNRCANECSYCAFRRGNSALRRRTLSLDEIAAETRAIVAQGHKRILLVAGEGAAGTRGLAFVQDAIRRIYDTKVGPGEVRRVNVNIAPLTEDGFRALHSTGIGTYQLFQETYHRPTYQRFHVSGPKADYDWRLSAMDRAMAAGINDVGIGALFGLHDWRYEVLALIEHAAHLERRFGVGPHTISVPRLEPAEGSACSSAPPHAVSDADFLKIVAVLRLAVPYTGIIMSTRESAALRRRTFQLGVSQISAGSRTNPGGYGRAAVQQESGSQFQLGDHRSLDEVVRDVASMGFVPSFCTACYRLGRTGRDFMDLAKPGAIKTHCDPNALSTCLEYLLDYASPATRATGEQMIETKTAAMPAGLQAVCQRLTRAVRRGQRDVLV
jgi:2-iminoacetate synthase